MVNIEHIALWANDIEKQKEFYQKYFGAKVSSKYTNDSKQFQSYFLEFDINSRLELMQRPDVKILSKNINQEFVGYAHIALSVGSEKAVDEITDRLDLDGYKKLDGPRLTGDGYYESVFLDPENNRLEITV